MTKPWETDSCEHVQSYYTIYPVPVAAALWCGIPPTDVEEHLNSATQVHRAIYQHPYIKFLEPRCRAIQEAIEKGILPVSRENGKPFDGSQKHVAPEHRHVTWQNLEEWVAHKFPSDKPAFLFDEIERKTLLERLSKKRNEHRKKCCDGRQPFGQSAPFRLLCWHLHPFQRPLINRRAGRPTISLLVAFGDHPRDRLREASYGNEPLSFIAGGGSSSR